MMILALHLASPSVNADPNLVREFGRTCVASRSKQSLVGALTANGWKAFATVAESHLEREIAAVSPMLKAQDIASDYTIFGRDVGGQHLELALSETKKPFKDGRKLIGCSIYDFGATVPVDAVTINAFAPTISAKRSVLEDVQIEKWDNAFGDGSGMRSVFVPSASKIKVQIGFTGMMLGTHFLDAAE